jgi:hypothetical protein
MASGTSGRRLRFSCLHHVVVIFARQDGREPETVPITMKTKALLIALALGSAASAADPADLIRLYEEEILAHDLYVALGEKYPDIRPLQNIPHSEASHREVMAGILKAEGIEIPKAPEGRRFSTKGLDRLYRQWLKAGSKSEVDACIAGVRLEDHDIADLREAQAAFPKHKEALAGLEAASNNHLRAFHRNMTGRGGKYEPEALSAADFTTIADGEMERGACGEACDKNCDADCGATGGNAGKPGCGDCGKSCDKPGGPGAGQGRGPRARNGQEQGKGPRNGSGPGNGQGRQNRFGQGGPNR